MSTRIVVDPITRIEGHLRIEAEVKDGRIVDAWSAGTMVRGIEIILKGRDPRDAWAFTERVCGVCTTVHALASVRSVEDALGIAVPPNAELIRNLMFCAQYMQDHVVHFYHLHALDWVDVVSALQADPAEASRIAQSISNWPKSSVGYFKDLQKRLGSFVESGQLGIFANAYWGHPAYKLPPAVNLIGVAHYLEALEWQKEMVKVHTVFGGKNPHPNYLVGGVPCSINIDEANAINADRLAQVGRLFEEGQRFIEQVYIPDLLAVAPYYLDWTEIGGGVKNYLCYGDLPTNGFADIAHFKFARGAGAAVWRTGEEHVATRAVCSRAAGGRTAFHPDSRAGLPAVPGRVFSHLRHGELCRGALGANCHRFGRLLAAGGFCAVDCAAKVAGGGGTLHAMAGGPVPFYGHLRRGAAYRSAHSLLRGAGYVVGSLVQGAAGMVGGSLLLGTIAGLPKRSRVRRT